MSVLPEPDSMSTAEKIGQLLFIGIPGDRIDNATSSLLDEVRPGGLCLFARNIKTTVQTRELLDGLRFASLVVPFLSVDQEGGLVDRLRRLFGPMPAASKLRAATDAARLAEIIGDSLRWLGFNMDFAPVVDVIDKSRSGFSNGLHSRAFGTSVDQTLEMASSFLRALQEKGVIGCLKHFPGLGASRVDSHEELPAVGIEQDEFESVDLLPYRRLLATGDVHAVMVAHAAYPLLGLQERDADGKLLPASLSRNVVTRLLREEMGFDGVILTDDLEMGAIVKNYGIGEAAVAAIEAGHDMVAVCAGEDSIRSASDSLSAAVAGGRLSMDRLNTSVKRIFRLKSRLSQPDKVDSDLTQSFTERISLLNQSLA